MQINTTYINNVNETVDSTEYATHLNKWSTNEVIKIDDKEITIIEGTDVTAVLIVVVAVGILILLIVLVCARYAYQKMRAEKAQAELIKNTQAALAKDGKIKVIPREKNFAKVEPGDGEMPGPIDKDEEIYEEQYDPNQEFRIFGVGD
jgi:beta-lactamase regulating signal transducer with metallopeptidase domain